MRLFLRLLLLLLLIRQAPAVGQEPDAFQFSAGGVGIFEGGYQPIGPVVRFGDRSQPATVRLLTVTSTATAGLDYEPVDVLLHFAADEASKDGIELRTVQNLVPEITETFSLVLLAGF